MLIAGTTTAASADSTWICLGNPTPAGYVMTGINTNGCGWGAQSSLLEKV